MSISEAVEIINLKNPIVAICPCCGNKIYAKDLDFDTLNYTEIKNYPFELEFVCKKNHYSKPVDKFCSHILTIYMDQYLNVRGLYVKGKFTSNIEK